MRLDDETLLMAFGRASDALAAAIAAQEAVGSGQWAVGSRPGSSQELKAPIGRPDPTAHYLRIVLHLGEVEPGEGAERSSAIPHATRLLHAAHPGQILLSEETAGLLRHELEPGLLLEDLGTYRLRDQEAPERLFQARHEGMGAREFPLPAAPPGPRSHLPLQFTRFIGRQSEIARLEELLRPEATGDRRQATVDAMLPPSAALRAPASRQSSVACRLVTLTGPGGSGKTRLALEVAARLRETFAGAVWFVPLADVTEPRLTIEKTLDALRLSRSSHLQPLEQVVAILSGQPSVLLLDNFEHLLGSGTALVQMLLERAPTLRIVVTSRQRLDLVGEREFPLSPLGTPPPAPRVPPPAFLSHDEKGDAWASRWKS